MAAIEYFSKFPTTLYSFDSANNDFRTVINILDRTAFLPQVLTQGLIFYPYNYKEGDKPEIIADKYYGDTKRHWIVMYANQIIDPWNDFALNQNDLNNQIITQYGSLANAASNLHHIEMHTTTLTISPLGSANTQTIVTILTTEPYTYNFSTGHIENITLPNIANPTISVGSNTVITHDGSTVTISQVMVAVSVLNYLQTANDNKRAIQLVDKQYVDAIEQQFEQLLTG